MKNLFILSEEEKNRILNLHESATKRQYLSEQEIKQGSEGDPYQYKKVGNDYYYAFKKGGTWTKATKDIAIRDIKNNIFNVSDTTLPKQEKYGSKTKIPNNFKETNRVVGDTTYDTAGIGKLKRQSELSLKSHNESVKMMGKMPKRTYDQIISMISKNTLKDTTFIVINKDNAIASLFGPNYTYIGKSSITTGKSLDSGLEQNVNLDYGSWMKVTFDYIKENPTSTDAKEVKKFIEMNKSIPGLVKSDGTVNYDVYEKNKNNLNKGFKSVNNSSKDFPFSYAAKRKLNLDFTPSGTFKLSDGFAQKHFGSGKDGVNAFPLVNVETGEVLSKALHAYAGNTSKKLIDKFSKQDMNLSKPESRKGYGCINVDEKFIEKVNNYKPEYVIILPDTGELVSPKIVTWKVWSDKIVSLGDKCVKSLTQYFS